MMKIKSLEIENIASLVGKNSIDFSKGFYNNIFLISGETGIGKSSILDSITLALYGQTARLSSPNIREIITKEEERASVKLSFTFNGKSYESFIEIFEDKKKSTKMTLHEGEERSLLADSLDSVKSKIKAILGLDFEYFKKTVLLPQGEFQSFLQSEPKKRSELLSNIFNIKKYDKLEDLVKAEFKEREQERTSLREALKDLEAKLKDFNLNKIEEEQSLLQGKRSERELYFKTLNDFIEKLKEIKREVEGRARQVNDIAFNNKTLEDLNESLESLKAELLKAEERSQKLNEQRAYYLELREPIKREERILELEDNLKTLNEKKLKLTNLTHGKAYLEEASFNKIRDLFRERETLSESNFDEREHNKLSSNLKQTQQDLKALEEEVERLKSKIFNRENLEKYIEYEKFLALENYAKSKVSELAELEKERAIFSSFKKSLINDFEAFKGEREKLEGSEKDFKLSNDAKLNLAGEMKLLKERESKRGELLKVEREQIKALEESEIREEKFRKSLKRCQEINRELESEDASLAKLSLSLLERERREYIDNEKKILALDAQIKLVSQERDKLSESEVNANFREFIAKFKTIKEAIEVFKVEKSEIEEQSINIESCLNELNKEISHKEGAIKTRDENRKKLEISLNEIDKSLEEAFLSLKSFLKYDFFDANFNLNEDFFNLKIEQKMHSFMSFFEQKLASFLQKEVNLRREIEDFSVKIGEIKSSLSHYRANEKEREEKEESLQNTTFKYEITKIVNNIITGSGAKHKKLKHLIQEQIFMQIIKIANEKYLHKLKENINYSLEFKSDKKQDKFEINIIHKANKESKRSIATLSGGEQFIVSLSLSLSLSDVLRHNSNKFKIDCFFLDEGFGTLDEETLKEVIKNLNHFQNQTSRQIGIISHVNYLKEYIKEQILLKREKAQVKISFKHY